MVQTHRFTPAHIDLRFLLRRIGYRGGLKKIEKELGISRAHDISDLNPKFLG